MIATEQRKPPSVEDMRLMAQRLEHENPSWIVLYGPYSKEFVALNGTCSDVTATCLSGQRRRAVAMMRRSA